MTGEGPFDAGDARDSGGDAAGTPAGLPAGAPPANAPWIDSAPTVGTSPAGAPTAQPDNPVAVAARGSRLLRGASRIFRLDALIPFMIAAVSLIGAAVTWQASDTAASAGGLDAQVLREATERQQILTHIRGVVVYDQQIFAEYQEHITAWHDLDARAEVAIGADPALARRMRFQAQSELAMARTLRPLFRVFLPDFGGENGLGLYDREAALAYLTSIDSRLAELDPESTRSLAVARHGLAIQLVAVVIALVGSLFLLTVSQLGRGLMRLWFGVFGILLATMASGLFIALEVRAG